MVAKVDPWGSWWQPLWEQTVVPGQWEQREVSPPSWWGVMEGFQCLLEDMMGSQLAGKKTSGKSVLGRESSIGNHDRKSGSIEHHRWPTPAGGPGQVRGQCPRWNQRRLEWSSQPRNVRLQVGPHHSNCICAHCLVDQWFFFPEPGARVVGSSAGLYWVQVCQSYLVPQSQSFPSPRSQANCC